MTNNKSKNYKVLIIEDDEPTLESAIIKFKKEGFEVDSAINGRTGIEKARVSGPFSIILLDLLLPEGDGFDFLEELGKEPKFKNIPVFVFTNLDQPEFREKALKLGAKGYMLKSNHDIGEIVMEVKKCLLEDKCLVDSL